MDNELMPCPVCGGEGYSDCGLVYCESDYCYLRCNESDWNTLSRAVQLAKSVVRCGECRNGTTKGNYVVCRLDESEPYKPEHFCSYGKRK